MTTPVVLLHGLARTRASMAPLARHLKRRGFATWARTYPSRQMGISELGDHVASLIRDEFQDRPVWAVTHSLGGILVRHMADKVNWAGVVMLAPPNQGSRVARLLKEHPLYQWFYGPAGQEVATPINWPQPPKPCGVIAGTQSVALNNPTSWVSSSFKLMPPLEPSDGTISVAETKLESMTDFATVDASHTWIMNHRPTRDLVVRFIETQHFES